MVKAPFRCRSVALPLAARQASANANVAWQISLDGIVNQYSTTYLGQYAVTLLAHDISSNTICRVTDEPEALLKAREEAGLPFYPNLLANDRIAYYVDVNNVSMTVNNSRAAWRPDVVANIGFNTTGGLFDGDRCCKPTLLNFGYQCGVNFEDDSIATVSITWPQSSPGAREMGARRRVGSDSPWHVTVAASVAGVVVSWFRPCFNMPDRYRMEYRTVNDFEETWCGRWYTRERGARHSHRALRCLCLGCPCWRIAARRRTAHRPA